MPQPRSDVTVAGATHPRAFNERPGAVDQGTVQRLLDQEVLGDATCPFAVGVIRLEPRQVHPLHLHTAATEFYFVVAGRARFTVGDEIVDGTPGTTMYLPIGLPHAIETDDEPVEVLYGFTPSDIAALGTTFI